MFSWLKKEGEKTESIENVVEGLKRIYKTKLLPLELHYQFHDFHSPQLEDPDFDAKPMILLVGQYSTGKTTFIKYLLERDFPGIRIGPEPTTDRFIAVMYDEKEGVIPGNALVVDPKKQFRPLSKFGNAFLNRFQCSTVSSPVLRGISIVDTPGILSGEKQRVDRGYDFTGVLEWFAERVDRIILLFDAHKLDISDEFRRSIEALRGHDDKIRIVLNKADMIDHQQLMRVYGALMWSLGKVLQTPEVARVYIGSFWDQPLRYDVNRRLFEDEEQDLFRDMQSLPRNAALRKLNDLIKRARLAKVHAFIVSELRKEMPSMFGKDGKKKDLIKNLGQVYDRIQREQQISPGDFPDIKKMQENLANHDFSKFHPLKPKLLEVVDHMLATDIARLMDMIPQEDVNIVSEPLIKDLIHKKASAYSPLNNGILNAKNSAPYVLGGAFEGVEDQVSPFGYGRGEGVDAGHGDPEWICSKEKPRYDQIFQSLNPIDGKVTGAGMQLSVPSYICNPHLRGTIIINKALDAMLSSTQNCTSLTELCMALKDRKDDSIGGDTLNRLTDTLAVATQNSNMIAQFIANCKHEGDNRRLSNAVSINTLNDTVSLQGASTSFDYHVETDRSESRNSDIGSDDSKLDDVVGTDGRNAPNANLNLEENHDTSIFHPIIYFSKLIFLIVLNVMSIMITTQVAFITILYLFTGEIYLEFNIEKKPQSFFEHAAKTEMVKSKLPNSVLGKIWKLSDIDKDGFLDDEEFALAMHLIRVKIDGHDLPSDLPPHLVPPSKRN
ncbi:unnamed protein product [Diatraea saccharalis]|uniref:EH domain-containing protein n=1 Tax=Diatraea saccharalis TaxID=40085 RepID=A0A9N9RBM8_9NEOP|nr:unnamed protein product [Diatraea saccharalis]